MQVCLTHADRETIGVPGRIGDLEVERRPGARRAAAERLCPTCVGEHVVTVTPSLDDLERRVQRHPEEEVRHLAEAPAHTRCEASVIEDQPFDESTPP
jgi:hypothetical protein